MSPDGCEIRALREAEHAAALACYRRNGYTGHIRAGDRALVALQEDAIVGVVRLVEEEGHQLLRGMFLDEGVRARGLGTRMVAALMALADERPCWLLCGPHLIGFYGRAGFRLAPDDEAPPHVQQRVGEYREVYGPQCVLRRG